MPDFEHIVSSEIAPTFRNRALMDQYELSLERVGETIRGSMPFDDFDWRVGVIYGASGTGKSTIARAMFGDSYVRGYEYGRGSVVDEMPRDRTLDEIASTFNSVGFATVWSWLKPYSVLSTGEKMRVDLARALLSESQTVVFDEYTSVVNRDVAKFGSFAVQKAVRRSGKRFVAVSCHYDVIEWLEPDWTFCTDTMEFRDTRGLLRREPIRIDIAKVHHSAWSMFRKYHYLDTSLNKSAECYCAFYDNSPIAFCATLHFPHPKVKNTKRVSRVVVLPDYQGCGVGARLTETLGALYAERGHRLIITFGNKTLLTSYSRSTRWVCRRVSRTSSGKDHSSSGMGASRSSARYTYSYEYVGDLNAA